MTDAYGKLERQFDGPIPKEALDRLRYGSSLNAEIVRTENLVAYYFGEIARTKRSAKRWLERGNQEMHDQNLADVEFYDRQWRALRARLTELRGTNAAVQGAGRFFDALSPKGRDDEDT